MGESCLSKYANIFWMTAGSVIQAIILTLVFLHCPRSVMSMLKTFLINRLPDSLPTSCLWRDKLSFKFSTNLRLFLPRYEAVTRALTLLSVAKTALPPYRITIILHFTPNTALVATTPMKEHIKRSSIRAGF